MVVAVWRWFGLGCCGLLAAASQTAGDASQNVTAPLRRLQTGPWRVILPYPNPELCDPKECFLRIPASAFPPETEEEDAAAKEDWSGSPVIIFVLRRPRRSLTPANTAVQPGRWAQAFLLMVTAIAIIFLAART